MSNKIREETFGDNDDLEVDVVEKINKSYIYAQEKKKIEFIATK